MRNRIDLSAPTRHRAAPHRCRRRGGVLRARPERAPQSGEPLDSGLRRLGVEPHSSSVPVRAGRAGGARRPRVRLQPRRDQHRVGAPRGPRNRRGSEPGFSHPRPGQRRALRRRFPHHVLEDSRLGAAALAGGGLRSDLHEQRARIHPAPRARAHPARAGTHAATRGNRPDMLHEQPMVARGAPFGRMVGKLPSARAGGACLGQAA